MSAQRREILIDILRLIARLECATPADAGVVQQACLLLGEERDLDALNSLRRSSSSRLVTASWLMESYLIDADQD